MLYNKPVILHTTGCLFITLDAHLRATRIHCSVIEPLPFPLKHVYSTDTVIHDTLGVLITVLCLPFQLTPILAQSLSVRRCQWLRYHHPNFTGSAAPTRHPRSAHRRDNGYDHHGRAGLSGTVAGTIHNIRDNTICMWY